MSFFTLVFHEHRLQITGYLLFQSLLRMVSIAHLLLDSFSRVTGNLRIYIYDKTKPFPWRLRVSFATDIARALAYLHARRCIHRDLKGENLLVTPNGRLKITDFGFARIAARNADEIKRLTFCGTDSYMSPEILLGDEFDLPTDVYSLGVIFCEILARKLADDFTFKVGWLLHSCTPTMPLWTCTQRPAPSFNIDNDEVRQLASPGAPADFLQLAIDCCALRPADRPTTPQILARLRAIEVEVLSRPSEADDLHVGSVKFFTQKRSGAPHRMPSFSAIRDKEEKKTNDSPPEDSDDEELIDAVNSLQSVTLEGEDNDSTAWSQMTAKEGHFAGVKDSLQLKNGHTRVNGDGVSDAGEPLLAGGDDESTFTYSDYSTSVVKGAGQMPPSLSSIMTVRPTRSASEEKIAIPSGPTDSMLSIDSFHTARSSSILNAPSIAAATEGGSSIRPGEPSVMLHRFTLIKPGASGKKLPTGVSQGITSSASQGPSEAGWSPFDFFFSSGLVAKCDLCHKRLGWKPVLECDDCGLKWVTEIIFFFFSKQGRGGDFADCFVGIGLTSNVVNLPLVIVAWEVGMLLLLQARYHSARSRARADNFLPLSVVTPWLRPGRIRYCIGSLL
jgi:LIM domain kinase 1